MAKFDLEELKRENGKLKAEMLTIQNERATLANDLTISRKNITESSDQLQTQSSNVLRLEENLRIADREKTRLERHNHELIDQCKFMET